MDDDKAMGYRSKCGFSLAEERKKRKTFFSHTAGRLGTGVQGVSRHLACVRFQFLFCRLPLPYMPQPPTHLGSTCRMCKVEVKLFSSHFFVSL